MVFLKRTFLLIITNILIVITISLLLSLLGVRQWAASSGIDYVSLMTLCGVWGFGGAFISLAISRIMAKLLMGVRVIPPETSDPALQNLLQIVHQLSRSAHLPKMPEVGIYESPEINAFATGPSKSRALVAVSTGLLQKLSASEVEGVLAHEISHVSNGDMVTMTLIQGVINAFVMFLARVLAFFIAQAVRNRSEDESSSPTLQYLLTFVLEIILSLLGSMIVCYFSRIREFSADRDGAKLAGREKMISALQGLSRSFGIYTDSVAPQSMATLQITGRKTGGLWALLSTHPPLEERIARLQNMNG